MKKNHTPLQNKHIIILLKKTTMSETRYAIKPRIPHWNSFADISILKYISMHEYI